MSSMTTSATGPFPTDKPNVVRFQRPDGDPDIYVQLLDHPDSRFPNFFVYAGRVVLGGETMIGSESVRHAHPALNHLDQFQGKPDAGWWSDNLTSLCRDLGMNHAALCPAFGESVRQCGMEVVHVANRFFERQVVNRDRSIMDYAHAVHFAGGVINFLETGDDEYMKVAKRYVQEASGHDFALVNDVASVLVKYGFWNPDGEEMTHLSASNKGADE